MERCPACHARLRDSSNCPRCKADLSQIISAEKAAKQWLSQAIQLYLDNNLEQCILTIGLSIQCKSTDLALVFREFLTNEQCMIILDLLANNQLISAKQILYRIRYLFPYSIQLKQLNDFSDYLLIDSME